MGGASELAAQAAVASGWPTLQVFADDEPTLLAARRLVEEHLGPLPQADEIEPFDPGDPDDRWELRIDLPGLDLPAWQALARALDGFDAALHPGAPPAVRAAEDAGQRDHEEIVAGDVVARMAYDPVEGGVHGPELEPGLADPTIEALEAELVDAVRDVSLALCFESDRGPDTVQPVVDRATGRFGVQVAFPSHQVDVLPGDELLDLRQRLVAALAGVIASRRAHPVARLAPDLLWDTRFGLVFTLWFVAPPLPGLPGDTPLPAGRSPRELDVEGLDGLVDDLEVQVVPSSPADHDDVIAAVAGVDDGGLLRGSRPRWLRGPDGLAFCPTWRAPCDAAVMDLADRIAALPRVAAVRVVPGTPRGMGELWPRVDPAWTPAGARCCVRFRDGVTDRDWLAPVTERPRDDRDDRLDLALGIALPAGMGLPRPAARQGARSRPVRDEVVERDGLEVAFEGGYRGREAALTRLLRALGRVRDDDVAPWIPYAHRAGGVVVRFWYRDASAS